MSTIETAYIRGWCMRRPRPKTLRLHVGDEVSEISVEGTGQSWAQIAESLVALEPDLIEAMSADGKVIRAERPGTPSRDNRTVESPKILHTDPETARLTHFADLLHRAYQHTTDVAFTKLVELVERMDNRMDRVEARLERTERAYHRELMDRVDEAYERAEQYAEEHAAPQPTDGVNPIIEAFMNGMHARRAAVPKNGKPAAKGAPE
jgi:ElaB/YqjD/DUF883 family membrane-anchored ribosome-binding protein